jgi:hypothetical protein
VKVLAWVFNREPFPLPFTIRTVLRIQGPSIR